jgi:pantoate--beta-alanine ligase
MKIFKSRHKLKNEILNIKNISFVPTMGGLHKGHASLIKKSKRIKGKTLVSIFVNPKQFNNQKDFFNYPKNLKKDISLLKRLKVDLLFIPSVKDVYSFKAKNDLFLEKFSKQLCGKTRKGHFEGVLNVVNRFLEIIKPKYVVLGNKDLQQSRLVNTHIQKKKIKTRIVKCKIIREKNGVACSTRNKNLTNKQLKIASKIYLYLTNKKKKLKSNLLNYSKANLINDVINLGSKKVDYIELLNSNTLNPIKSKKEKFRIFIAYYLNNIRLIDNI